MAGQMTDINLKSPTPQQGEQFGWRSFEAPPPYIHNTPYPMENTTNLSQEAVCGNVPMPGLHAPAAPAVGTYSVYPPASGSYPGSGSYQPSQQYPSQRPPVTIVTGNAVQCHHTDKHLRRRRILLLILPFAFFCIAVVIIVKVAKNF